MSKKENNNKLNKTEVIIYQPKGGGVEFRVKLKKNTIWLDAHQMAQIFGVNRPAVVKHINNIYKTGELSKKSTCSILEQVATDGRIRKMNLYNLDMVISVGYRVNSKKATKFRIWATKILKDHVVKGYTIDKKRVGVNYQKFLKAVGDVRAVLPSSNKVDTKDVLELVNTFAATWFSLDAYDTDKLPKKGITRKQIYFTAEELGESLEEFRKQLIAKKQATEIFGQERDKDAVKGIVGNVFQSFAKKDLYSTAEEKAAHLLYFMVKNHPFVDGNKRSGAFAFVWFLRKVGILCASLTPEALTALTLLIAKSNAKDKERIVRLVILLLK